MGTARGKTRVLEIETSARAGSPQSVMERVRRPSTWPEWQSEILSTEGPDELRIGDHVIGDARMLGFLVGGRADVVDVDDAGLEQDVIVGIRMKVAYSLERRDDEWIVTHRLVADLPRGVAGRVLSFFLARRLRRMQQGLLERLTGGEALADAPPARGADAGS